MKFAVILSHSPYILLVLLVHIGFEFQNLNPLYFHKTNLTWDVFLPYASSTRCLELSQSQIRPLKSVLKDGNKRPNTLGILLDKVWNSYYES